MAQIMDTERRIEKAFHDQTQFLSDRLDRQSERLDRQTQALSTQTQWMVGLIITMTVAIIAAVLFKGA